MTGSSFLKSPRRIKPPMFSQTEGNIETILMTIQNKSVLFAVSKNYTHTCTLSLLSGYCLSNSNRGVVIQN